MSFTDELRKMEKQPKVQNNIKFENHIKEIYAAVKSECVKNINRHSVNGFILHHYDDEYCVYGFEFKDTLRVDNSKHLGGTTKYRNKSDKYHTNIALERYYLHNRDGYEPITNKKDECDLYISRLKELLVKDGFKIRTLTSNTVVDEYETIEHRGFINPKEYLEKHTTSTVVGYVIALSIEW